LLLCKLKELIVVGKIITYQAYNT